MQGIEVIADDLIIAGATEEEHDHLLRNVMQRAREQNVEFNPKKIQFKLKRVVYFGTIFSEDGIPPDPAKVKAMVERIHNRFGGTSDLAFFCGDTRDASWKQEREAGILITSGSGISYLYGLGMRET